MTAPIRLLAHLQKLFPSSTDLSIRFTVSPSWLKKAGTVAFAISGPHHASSSSASSEVSSSSKGRITSRDGGGWRPSSLFGGWGSEKASPIEPEISELVAQEGDADTTIGAEGDDEEEGGDTIKGEKGTSILTSPPASSLASRNGSTMNRTRLSALFTDWIAPEATPQAQTSPESKTRIVGGPRPMSMDLSKRFSSFTPGDRASMLSLQENLREEEEEEELGNVTEELESLMVSFLFLSFSIYFQLTR